MSPTSDPRAAERPAAAAVSTVDSRARWAPWLALGAAVAGGAALVAVGPGDGRLPLPGCPFHALTGWDCPACGVTRGVRQLLSGHPLAALDHNVLLALVVPVVAWAWLAWAGLPPARGLPRPRRLGGRAGAVLLGALVAFAVVRNLPLPGVRWLASGR